MGCWARTIFFISDTILQVHAFGDSHETEVQKELVWVDQNNKKCGFFCVFLVFFFLSIFDIKSNHPRKDILKQK